MPQRGAILLGLALGLLLGGALLLLAPPRSHIQTPLEQPGYPLFQR